MSVESRGPKKRKLEETTEYTVGFGKGMNISCKSQPRGLHLAVSAAKHNDFEVEDFWQCVAQTATLYKTNKDAGKSQCSVWGVLSNATDWMFIYIDESGKLWRSEKYYLDPCSYNEEQVAFVYRVLHFLVKRCFESCTTTPTLSPSSAD